MLLFAPLLGMQSHLDAPYFISFVIIHTKYNKVRLRMTLRPMASFAPHLGMQAFYDGPDELTLRFFREQGIRGNQV